MSFFRKVLSAVFGSAYADPVKVIIVGLDAAGKTTLLYRMRGRHDDILTTIPTIGFNVETLQRRDLNMTCWDIGGCDKIRPLWRHYYQDMTMLMFVVDSNDRERLPSASEELDYFLSDSSVPSNIPVLIMANKQDLPDSMSVMEITEKLQLHTKMRNRQWYVCPSCAVDGSGISQAIQWMQHAVRSRNSHAPEAVVPINHVAPQAVVVNATSVVDEVAAAKALERQVNRRTILEEWQTRAWRETDEAVSVYGSEQAANETFIAAVADASLPSWDHYTHIKLGYLVLTDRREEQEGASSGASFDLAVHRVCGLIEGFIARSSRTNGRSFHCTMTHFWCHMIAVQLSFIQQAGGEAGDGLSLNAFMESLWSAGAVELWDGKLYAQYYSNPVMFGAEAKRVFVAPDLKRLPSIH